MNTACSTARSSRAGSTTVRLYEGVRTRRVFAFLIDYLIVALLLIPFAILVFLLGLLTSGSAGCCSASSCPAVALPMSGTRSAARNQATTGMRMMGIRLDRLDGGRVDGMLAVVHSVLFWAGNVVLTPLILLATLFLDRKRTVHDLLLGTVVVRTDR